MTDSTKTTASPKRRFALWQGAAALSTLALVPLATGAMATVGASKQQEIARFMDVFLEVKSNYVEPVRDDNLIEGAINNSEERSVGEGWVSTCMSRGPTAR